jgi:hypothetical protein
MKRIALVLALFCLGLVTASLAVAKAPPGKGKLEDKGKGKKTTTSSTATDLENCKPKVSVILKGKFVSGGGSSFTIDVSKSNFHGKEFSGTSLTLMVDDKTRFVRQGPAELSDFEAGDRLNVQARACKKQKKQRGDSSGSSQAPSAQPAAMLAKRVVGRPANPAETAGETTTTTTP